MEESTTTSPPKAQRASPEISESSPVTDQKDSDFVFINEEWTSTDEAQEVPSTNLMNPNPGKESEIPSANLMDPVTGKESEISSEMPQEKTPNNDPVVIMIAGKVGNGKSTALNNIFGLHLETKSSSTSVTEVITIEEVVKNGVTVRIIDTPGLGSVSLDTNKIIDEMASATKGLNFLLLYCLGVRPSDILTEVDEAIIRNLQQTLGAQVWQKCVLLLTFGDVIRGEEYSSPEQDKEYIAYIKDHAQQFQNVLQEETKVDIRVKTIFDYASQEERERQETSDAVVAIPVKKQIKGEHNILPGIMKDDDFDWTDIVFLELMKKKDMKERVLPLIVKHGSDRVSSPLLKVLAGGTLGVVFGAGVGTVAGIIGGPIGMIAGALIGATIGGTVGLPMYKIVGVLKKRSSK